MTFSGGIIDLTLFGILQGNSKTNWIWVVVVGLGYFAVYFLLFRFLIRKKNYITPGREEIGDDVRLYTREDYNEKQNGEASPKKDSSTSVLILEGLGGRANIKDIDCCATRLRVTVESPELVKDELLKQSGAAGVIKKGNGIQVVYGPQVAVIKSELEDYMEKN
jgi:PTS system D-glucosamine-specific IIC component